MAEGNAIGGWLCRSFFRLRRPVAGQETCRCSSHQSRRRRPAGPLGAPDHCGQSSQGEQNVFQDCPPFASFTEAKLQNPFFAFAVPLHQLRAVLLVPGVWVMVQRPTFALFNIVQVRLDFRFAGNFAVAAAHTSRPST